MFLRGKEAQASVLADYCGQGRYPNQGQLVAAGQHLMQVVNDIFLSWDRVTGFDGVERDFYVRQLRDWKFSFPIEQMIQRHGPVRRAVRLDPGTGQRLVRVPRGDCRLSGHLQQVRRSGRAFAELYADQNDLDHAALAKAVATGRVEAESDL